jgi:hypothetical protein
MWGRQEANANCFETSNTCNREYVLDATFEAMRRSYEKAVFVLSAWRVRSRDSSIA